jgi:hypothetical protein
MNESLSHYDQLSLELAMLVKSLELRKQHELPQMLLEVMKLQEEYLVNSLAALRDTKSKMENLIECNDIHHLISLSSFRNIGC